MNDRAATEQASSTDPFEPDTVHTPEAPTDTTTESDPLPGEKAETSEASPEPRKRRASRIEQLRDGGIIDLRWLLILWLKWSWLIVLAGLPAVYLGYKDLVHFVPSYTARMVVMPTGSAPTESASAARGVASQLGLNIGGPVADKDFNRFRLLLGSPQLARLLQDEHGLMQIIFKGAWDEESKSWKRPTGEDFERDQAWKSHLNLPTWSAPTIYSLADYLAASVTIESDKTSGFYELTVRHPDSDFAVWLLETVYRTADRLLRETKKQEITQQRSYINRQLAEQSSIDIRNMLLNLLASVERKEMALQSASLISSQILIEPYVRPGKSAPNISLLVYAPMLGSMAVAMALITVIALFRTE